MKKIKSFCFLYLMFSLSSCTILFNKQEVYQIDNSQVDDTVDKEKLTNMTRVSIKETNGNKLTIVFKKNPIPISSSNNPYTVNSGSGGKVTDDFRRSLSNLSYYWPDPEFTSQFARLNYMNVGVSLQALNVTFRNRFRIDPNLPVETRDSFPSTWSSGFSPSFAAGATLSYCRIKPNGKKQQHSLTFGGLLGFSTTDINSNTTRVPEYQFSRKALTNLYGWYINYGLQKWDFGFVKGWEHAFGDGSNSWVYQGQPFYGIIIGYDIVKLR